MIENLIYTILFAFLVFYAIGLIFDLYEARKNKNKIESFIYSLLLLVVVFTCCIVLYYKLPYIFLVYL